MAVRVGITGFGGIGRNVLRAAGIAAQDGRELLVHQGAAAFNRFFPAHPAPVEVMRAAVNRALRA